jgi:hypothetical protein
MALARGLSAGIQPKTLADLRAHGFPRGLESVITGDLFH